MNPHQPTIEYHGPCAQHDQCCPVIYSEPAVIDMNSGVFHPSWRAQRAGWALIKAETKFQRLVARVVFGIKSPKGGDKNEVDHGHATK